MGGVTTPNMLSSLQKYNKMYIVASCWTIIDTDSRCMDPWTCLFPKLRSSQPIRPLEEADGTVRFHSSFDEQM
jgi:hypothetical protein